MLIVISGLPATGKTTLAAALARRVRAVHLSVDTVEDALLRSGLEPGWTTGGAAYEAVSAAAQQNLVLGLSVVVDAVNDSEAARQAWRDAAARADTVVRFLLLLPPNIANTSAGSTPETAVSSTYPSRRGPRSNNGPRCTNRGPTSPSCSRRMNRSSPWWNASIRSCRTTGRSTRRSAYGRF